MCVEARTAAPDSSAFAAAVVDSKVRSIRSQFPPPRCSSEPRGQGPHASPEPAIKCAGYVSSRGVAASARHLLAWPLTGTVFTRHSGCGLQPGGGEVGEGLGIEGRPVGVDACGRLGKCRRLIARYFLPRTLRPTYAPNPKPETRNPKLGGTGGRCREEGHSRFSEEQGRGGEGCAVQGQQAKVHCTLIPNSYISFLDPGP